MLIILVEIRFSKISVIIYELLRQKKLRKFMLITNQIIQARDTLNRFF